MFIGLTLLLSDYVSNKRDLVFSEINLAILEEANSNSDDDSIEQQSEEVVQENVDETSDESSDTDDSNNVGYEYYLATLDIPKAGISRGFYDKTSSLNNVDLNVMILPESSYPDEVNGNVILAAHSGNYHNSYFTNLNKLVIGDKAYIKYRGITYTYQIVNIYDVDKTGTVSIYRDNNKSVLTMITCNLKDNTKQTIYISELIEKE